jgi:hypothetical protein
MSAVKIQLICGVWRTLKEILGPSSSSIDDNILHYIPPESRYFKEVKWAVLTKCEESATRRAGHFTDPIPDAQPYIAKQLIYIPPADL